LIAIKAIRTVWGGLLSNSTKLAANEIEMEKEQLDIRARLKFLETSIKDFRHKLELHGLFSSGHKITEKEFQDRLRTLRSEVDRTGGGIAADLTACTLEKAVRRWVASTDLKYKARV
jgi:hypothetical protein